MGWEYGIALENKAYGQAISALAAAFRELPLGDCTLVEDETGFALMNRDDSKWPERMQVRIDTANGYTGIVPAGEPYLYCIFYLGGKEAHCWIECIRTTLDGLGSRYFMDDL